MKKLVLIEGLEPDEEPDSSRPSEFTDDALALRLAEANANNLRYVAALGKWLLWDGMRWRFDDTLVARDVARKVCRQASSICNEPKVSKLIASAKTVSAVERLAQSDRELAATVDQWDCDPFLLNTPGGVIDLKSGAMGKHDPGDYLTKITGVAPDYQQTTRPGMRFSLGSWTATAT